MANAEYSGRGVYGMAPDQIETAAPLRGRRQKFVNILGAAGSLALVAGFGFWAWELAMRDIRGVPVIRAMEGPMRALSGEPGGTVMDHQGLAVNDVAARSGAGGSDRLVLAPAPVSLSPEDVPGLAAELPPAEPVADPEVELAAAEAEAEAARLDMSSIIPVIEGGQDDAVAAALALALGEETAAPPPGAMTRSLRPKPRPARLGANAAVTTVSAATPAKPVSMDPDQIASGTRLVQFGAYESAEVAAAQWVRIAGRLGPLMDGKAMVVQAAESGGQTFWRLRGHGFANEDESRRFCIASDAEGIKCIPVVHR